MTPTKFGKVDVMIVENKIKGVIALIYPMFDYFHDVRVICPLNTRQGFVHKKLNSREFRRWFQGINARHLDGEEAVMWLKKYCNKYKLKTSDFRIVSKFGRIVDNYDVIYKDLYEET